MIGIEVYIRAAGGVSEAARMAGVHRATVSRWQARGVVPHKYERQAREVVQRHIEEMQRATAQAAAADAPTAPAGIDTDASTPETDGDAVPTPAIHWHDGPLD